MKLKNTITFILIAGLVSLYVLHFTKPKSKIAYVDSIKLLNGYSHMQNARNEYEKKAKTWQSNIDTLMLGVQNQLKKYEKESQQLSEKERKLSRELIQNKQNQLVNYQKTIRDMAQQEDVRMTQAVVSEVNVYLERYGKEHDYDVILVANQTGNIAYAKEGMDITTEVLKELNQESQKSKK